MLRTKSWHLLALLQTNSKIKHIQSNCCQILLYGQLNEQVLPALSALVDIETAAEV
jgi:hypothetical protein